MKDSTPGLRSASPHFSRLGQSWIVSELCVRRGILRAERPEVEGFGAQPWPSRCLAACVGNRRRPRGTAPGAGEQHLAAPYESVVERCGTDAVPRLRDKDATSLALDSVAGPILLKGTDGSGLLLWKGLLYEWTTFF